MTQIVSGPQYSVPYVLQAADGTRAVFNDSTDPDYVGMLKEISGLDSSDIRENASDKVEDDGGNHGNFWLGRRPVVLTGQMTTNSSVDRNTKMTKLQQASMALRADAQLTWTPDGGTQQFIKLRRQQPVRITGGWVKDFQVPMVAADPRIYSTTITTTTAAAVAGSGAGFSFPVAFPLTFATVATYAQILAENQGSYETPPTIQVYGACVNPVIRNATLGKSITLNATLADLDYIEIDTLLHTVTQYVWNAATSSYGAGTSRYSTVDFLNTDWWRLQPGVNDIRFQPFSITGGNSKLVLKWRHAWA